MNPVFDLACRENAGNEIGANADRLKLRAQCVRSYTTIRTSDHTNPGLRERRHHPAKVIGRDVDVAVVDEDVVIPCLGQHLHQIAGLAIVAQNLRTDHQLD